MNKYINQIERINTDRWNTAVCVELKCSLDCTAKEQYKQIKQEILEIVNNCKTDVFYNANTGEKTYKYVNYVCECGLDKEHREHFYLHNRELDSEEFWEE